MSTPPTRYRDRAEAGRVLGGHLNAYVGRSDTLVLGLPRGGVPVAFEVARALQAPLDVFVVRKLGFPAHPELAMGAIASFGARVLNEDVLREGKVTREALEAVIARETAELQRRENLYRGGRPGLQLEGRTVIVIDDGLATGASLSAALKAVSGQRPARLVAGVPVGAADSLEALAALVDEMVCPLQPAPFYAVGRWYDDFGQTSDEEVCRCLADAVVTPRLNAKK